MDGQKQIGDSGNLLKNKNPGMPSEHFFYNLFSSVGMPGYIFFQ